MCNEIYLDAPMLGDLEKRYLNKAIDEGYVSTAGSYVPEFEEKFAKYLGVSKAISVQSGTAALHIALYELRIGKADEVIVPALTFIATVNPITYLGATPVFVDVDSATWNIDSEKIEEAITDKTKAILPVHLYGNPCAMDEIMRIAKRHGLKVVEDATESLGAQYKGKHTGTHADLGCYSFNGNKTITTGGGGMVVGSKEEKIEHIRFLANQAKDKSNSFYHPEIGFNYRMTNLEAALGLAQIERIDEFLEKKKKFNEIYKEELKNIKFISFQEEYDGGESSWWLSCIIFEKDIDISVLQEKLKSKGIPTRRTFMPVTEFPPYKKYKQANLRNSYRIYEKGLCLPSSALNSQEDIFRACKVLKGLVK